MKNENRWKKICKENKKYNYHIRAYDYKSILIVVRDNNNKNNWVLMVKERYHIEKGTLLEKRNIILYDPKRWHHSEEKGILLINIK